MPKGSKYTGQIHMESEMSGMDSKKTPGGCDKHGGGISHKGGPEKGPVGNKSGRQTIASSRRTK